MPHPSNIPLTPQTDERNFPRWMKDAPPTKSGSEYPKMLTRPTTLEDLHKWREKNKRRDQTTGQEYYESSPPRIGAPVPLIVTQEMVDGGIAQLAGEPVIVNDKEDEARVRVFLGLDEPEAKPQTVRIPLAAPVAASAEQPRPRRRRRTKAEMAQVRQEE